MALLEVQRLSKRFPVGHGLFSRKAYLQAVDRISFHLCENETLGLVGESGCGKSTACRLILRLIEPDEGEILFNGTDLCQVEPERIRLFRRQMQIIFQDPYSSLNPRKRVEEIVGAPLEVHGIARGIEKKSKVADILEKVGLRAEYMSRYPHEFSGGQRQRIGIARALILNPKLILADEPVSALDVSIQAQIINLLDDLREEFRLSYIFVSHDLGVVEHVCDRIAVMYLGRIVEIAPDRELYDNHKHPYTKALISAVPVTDPVIKRDRFLLQGEVPSAISPPSGCHFHPRCPERQEICSKQAPELYEVGPQHWVACHRI
ncbi:MAG: dipeptide ABC transporter ATP-binding protein [Proteobacteria bacterium]|nr:dipeptide ABC transporter ATP-binding protein [Pseudomonadota bacterium]NIS72648.1 dipeptide ABC transporter ATP-binding protein [Pseudomonadota bacterium]